ncbi:MAG: hypothetical protein ACJ71M_06465, partial [Nitrososphaeraceae archaeon]
MSTEIDVAKYLAELEKAGMQNPLGAINSYVLRLANDIRLALLIKEKALVVNGHTPLLEVNLDMNACSAEIFMWSIAILASAWTEWVFAAKSNNPDYKNNPEKNKAVDNAMLFKYENSHHRSKHIKIDKFLSIKFT